MKELNEYTAELHRRVEVECRTQRQHRIRTLAVCVPLLICVILGAVFLPPLVRSAGADGSTADVPVNTRSDPDQPDGAVLAGGAAGENRTGDDAEIPNSRPPVDGVLPDGTLPAPDGAEYSDGTVPEDFAFSFVWNTYGISSYDSETGKLVKTGDTTHPDDYITELRLTDEQRQEIWSWLSALDLETYPKEFDPYNAPDAENRVATEPNRTLILTVRADGSEKTVACRGICLGGSDLSGYDEAAQAFLDACARIENLLQRTPEWEALPEYEFFYD